LRGQLRIEYAGTIYHVMNGGIRRGMLVGDETDRKTCANAGENMRLVGTYVALLPYHKKDKSL